MESNDKLVQFHQDQKIIVTEKQVSSGQNKERENKRAASQT